MVVPSLAPWNTRWEIWSILCPSMVSPHWGISLTTGTSKTYEVWSTHKTCILPCFRLSYKVHGCSAGIPWTASITPFALHSIISFPFPPSRTNNLTTFLSGYEMWKRFLCYFSDSLSGSSLQSFLCIELNKKVTCASTFILEPKKKTRQKYWKATYSVNILVDLYFCNWSAT